MGSATRNIISASGPRQNRKYSIIIPAAGSGTRMKKYGAKPLIKINDVDTIINRQFQLIDKTFRWYEIILVTGFQHTKIENYVPSKIKTLYNEDYNNTNVIHSINIGLTACSTENVIIIYGDLIFNKFAINVPFNDESMAVISDTMKPEEIGCNIDNGYIEQMFYGINKKWAQITFLQGLELKLMKEFTREENNWSKYGFEAINYIISLGGKIRAAEPKQAKVIDIDTSLDLKRIPEIL